MKKNVETHNKENFLNECNNENEDLTSIFNKGQYKVKIIDIPSGTNNAPRQFRIYEPIGAEGKIPIVHFLHGFQLKYTYFDDILTHLSSHGFIVVSGQSQHKLIGGDTSIVEAEKIYLFITWLKENLASKISVIPDFTHLGVSGHSRGGKVTNRLLNNHPEIALSFFGVDPVDSVPPMGSKSDPKSLKDPVQFKGESMFLGTEKGPKGVFAFAPKGDNSFSFYERYPSPSHHIIAAGVGHIDMIDRNDISDLGLVRFTCSGASDKNTITKFISYTGGLMAAFFRSTLKRETKYQTILNDSSKHPFPTILVEHK